MRADLEGGAKRNKSGILIRLRPEELLKSHKTGREIDGRYDDYDDRSPRASNDTRYALTVAFVKPGRGACWNQV